jgi:hypothetical protein
MSERIELQQHGRFFAAQRRSGHWCLAVSDLADPSRRMMGHQ